MAWRIADANCEVLEQLCVAINISGHLVIYPVVLGHLHERLLESIKGCARSTAKASQ
jgi:hypothetical protein